MLPSMPTLRSRTSSRTIAVLVAGALTCAGTAQAAATAAASNPAAPTRAAAPHSGPHAKQHAPAHTGAAKRTGARHKAAAARPESSNRQLVPETFTGGAFDTCAAPTAATMAAWWGSSEFQAAGIYLGGVNRACPLGNLSAGWVHQVSAQGWRLIPAYVGLQAPCVTAPHLALMDPNNAQAQAVAEADDAAAQAAALDLAPGSAIYFDLENYRRNNPACTKTVLTYLDSWVRRLHTHGYLAGVYSSADSGIADLAHAVGTPGWTPPDAVWIARWDQVPSTDDPALVPGDWSQHQRIKQFSGGHKETHGPATIDVDGNFVDGPVAIVE
jgi:Domain of unknown function (DUF1906)